MDDRVQAGRPGKIFSLLRLLEREGVEGAIRSDLLDRGWSLDEVGSTFSWADLEGWLDNTSSLTAFHRVINPLGVFTDPMLQRLASIEDWLEMLYRRNAQDAEARAPVGAVTWEMRRMAAVEAAKKATAQPKEENTVIDVRAEIKRRQAAHARGEYSEPAAEKKSKSPRSSAAQAKRDEIARRIAAAN
ncbi:hypothetical protein [Rhodococcoides fascians]|uniref:hypothetical protein n=1 Tax=Rhodococcoides fascians TaxID=1828 RepID=UPI000522E93C|nr:hypothetical protein [Rhodococcus fascians]